MIYIIVTVVAILLSFLLKFIKRHLPSVVKNRWLKNSLVTIIPLVELIVWTLFFLWALPLLLGSYNHYNIVASLFIIMGIALFGWYFLRDFIAGVVLRIENGFVVGELIESSTESGKIKSIGYRSLEIVERDGEVVKIPYSKLANVPLIKLQDNSKWLSTRVELQFESSLDPFVIKRLLKERLLQMPWVLSQKGIEIELLSHKESHKASILFYTITKDLVAKSQESLEQFVTSQFGRV